MVSSEVLSVLSKYKPKKIDETTVEIDIGEGMGISQAIIALNDSGIQVQTIRSKSGRLEEVFVHLTADKQ